jgi:integral membrane protein
MRRIALAEATSFLALLVAAVVKRTGGGEEGVHILGPIHGGLFIAYLVIAANLRTEMDWPTRTTAWVVLAGIVPFGGYVVDLWLARQEAGERAART